MVTVPQNQESRPGSPRWVPAFEPGFDPASPDSELDSVFNAQQEDDLSQDRDRSKRVLRAALRLKTTTDLVDDNLEEAEKTIEDGVRGEAFKRSPILKRWMAESPHHIALMRPDGDKPIELERLYARRNDPLRRLTETEIESIAGVLIRQDIMRPRSAGDLGAFGFGFADDPEQAEFDATRHRVMSQLRQLEDFVAGKGKVGLFETPLGPIESGLGTVPFMGGVIGSTEIGRLYGMAQSVNADSATPYERAILLLYGRYWTASDARGKKFWAKVGEAASSITTFLPEFIATGGAFKITSEAAQAVVKKALRKVLRESVSKFTGKAVGALAGGVAQTAAQTPFFLTRDTIQRMMPGVTVSAADKGKLEAVLVNDGDNFVPALTKALAARGVENLSERSGAFVGFIANKAGVSRLKSAIVRRWFSRNPERGISAFLKEVASKAAWDGPIGEVFEERISELSRAALGIDPLPKMTLENLLAEAVAFSFPTGGALALRGASMVAEAKSNRDRLKAIQSVLRSMQTAKESPEVVENFLDRVVKGGADAHAFVSIESWEEEWSKVKDEAGNPVNPRAMANSLGVTPEDYQEAIDTKGDVQISMPAFALRVLMKPEGDAFLDTTRTNPLAPTVADAQPEEIPVEELPSTPGVTPEAAGIKEPTEEEVEQLKELDLVAKKTLEDSEGPSVLDSLFPEKQQKAVQEMVEDSHRKLTVKLAEELRKRKTRGFKVQRERVRKEIEGQVNQQKEYVALSTLKTGKLPDGKSAFPLENLKIDRDSLAEGFDAGILPKGIFAKKGEGFHPDEAADLLGYSGGAQLFAAIIDAEIALPREVLIEGRTNAKMTDSLNLIRSDPALLMEQAQVALHTTSRSKVLEADLKQLVNENPALFRRLLERVAKPMTTVKEMRVFAQEEIGKKIFADLTPSKYQAAARKAHRAAVKAFGKQDIAEAFDHKLAELRAVEFARAAQRVKEKGKKVPKLGRDLGKRKKQIALRKGGRRHMDAINDIRERFGFTPAEAIAPRVGGVAEWFEEEKKLGPAPFIDPILLIPEYRKDWQELNVATLLRLGDAMKHIWHVSQSQRKLFTSNRKESFDEQVDGAVQSMDQNRVGEAQEEPFGGLTPRQRFMLSLARKGFGVRKFSSLLQQLDGFKSGEMWDLMARPLNQAQDRELDMLIQSDKAMKKLLDVYTNRERRRTMHQKESVASTGKSFSKWDRIVVALNLGNADNREALKKGYTWSDEQINEITSTLTKKDWTFIQGVWDHHESFWPEIKALSEKHDGIPARKVEAVAMTVQTKDGKTLTLRGGYYPLDYIPDPGKAHKSIDEIVADSMQGKAFRESTQKSHRKNRVGSGGRKIRFDPGLTKRRLRDVIHDLTHYDWLVDSNRLLRNDKMIESIKAGIGPVGYQELQNTVDAVALNNRQNVDGWAAWFEWLARRTRGAVLVANVSTVFKQYLGLSATMRTIGSKWTMRGFSTVGTTRASNQTVEEWMASLSLFMKNRRGNQDRDMADSMSQDPGLFEGSAVADKVRAFENWGWGLIASTQFHVDRVTWVGAYHRFSEELGLNEAKTNAEQKAIEKRVVDQADQAVRDSQGSGLLGDLPSIMRQRGFARVFTIFQTFMVNQLSLFAKFAIPAVKRPGIKTISQAATTFIALYVIPQLLWDEAWSQLRGDIDEEPQSFPTKVVATGIKEFANSFPVAREVAPVVDRFTGQGGRDYRGPAGLTFLAEFIVLGGQVNQAFEDGEIDESLVRSAVRMSGIAIPGTTQLDRMISGYLAWRDEEGSAASLIFGRPRIR